MGKYAIICGDYTSTEYDTAQEAMDYVDDNVDTIRDEGGRNYPIQITDDNNEVVAERGWLSKTDLATWEIAE